MPFDAVDFNDPGDDPAAALRRYIAPRITCAEAMLANGSDLHLRQARFVVALVDHAILEHEAIWGEPPELGLLDARLELLRELLEEPSRRSG